MRQQRDRAEGLLYASQSELAQTAWRGNSAVLARLYLGATSPERRGWEYRFLDTLFNQLGQQTFRGHTGSVTSVCFSPDGKRLASAGGVLREPGVVKVWDAATGQEVLSLKAHTWQINSVCFSPDGTRLASASPDQMVRVWDVATGQGILTLKASKLRIVFAELARWDGDSALGRGRPGKPAPAELARWSE